jgi:hypothetical protein
MGYVRWTNTQVEESMKLFNLLIGFVIAISSTAAFAEDRSISIRVDDSEAQGTLEATIVQGQDGSFQIHGGSVGSRKPIVISTGLFKKYFLHADARNLTATALCKQLGAETGESVSWGIGTVMGEQQDGLVSSDGKQMTVTPDFKDDYGSPSLSVVRCH